MQAQGHCCYVNCKLPVAKFQLSALLCHIRKEFMVVLIWQFDNFDPIANLNPHRF